MAHICAYNEISWCAVSFMRHSVWKSKNAVPNWGVLLASFWLKERLYLRPSQYNHMMLGNYIIYITYNIIYIYIYIYDVCHHLQARWAARCSCRRDPSALRRPGAAPA